MKTVTMVSALLLLLSGCSSDSIFEGISDDNTDDAVIEEAALALDDEDYDGRSPCWQSSTRLPAPTPGSRGS